jgi:hypothetical protein
MDYCNGVQGFINFATSIPKNFIGCGISCPCMKCENKKYPHPDIVMMHLLHKWFMENYLCWYAHREVFVRNKRMEEMVVRPTSSTRNVQEVANDNRNPYKNMVMDAMKMNQDNVSQCPIIEEELNADAARFFDLLKDSDKPLWNGCMNHNKLSTVAQVFTIKSDHGLSDVGYDKIIKWSRSILPEGNRLKENFYVAKSMMKPLSLGYQKIDMCPNFYTIKSDHGLSDVGYDKIIKWARSILPEGNRLKENFYVAKSMMKPLSLGYQKIDMCPNLFMLYYLENVKLTECITCGHSRYKPRTGREKTLVAYKKLRYFPITPRLQRLFMSPRTAEHMTWHQSHDAVDGVMMHLSDGEARKHFNSVHPHFSVESRNVRLGLCTDGFNPFGSFATPYSCGRSYSRFITCHRGCI